jgi:hypothetical protein
MNEGRITRHYGFGAARIGLCPEPYVPERDESLAEGIARALRERSRDRRGLLGDAANLAPAAALGLILLLAFLLIFARGARDEPDVDLVLLASQPAPAWEPPAPEPQLARQAPPPPPQPQIEEPPPPATAKPTPPPPALAPPPPAPAAPEPVRAAPRPEPPPPVRPRPPVALPALAAAPAPPTPPTRRQRTRPTPAARPELPAPRGLSAPQQPSFEVARASAGRARPSRPLPTTPGRSAPALVGAPAPVPSAPRTSTAPRAARATPAPQPAERPRPRLALPSASPAATGPRPARVARAKAPTPAPVAGASRSAEPRLAGVPLASLASCVSDQQEDALKRRVIAARPSAECVSPAGRYRFVETKNLNAFLMWVERSASREVADRCVELALALDCLEARRARGARGSRG